MHCFPSTVIYLSMTIIALTAGFSLSAAEALEDITHEAETTESVIEHPHVVTAIKAQSVESVPIIAHAPSTVDNLSSMRDVETTLQEEQAGIIANPQQKEILSRAYQALQSANDEAEVFLLQSRQSLENNGYGALAQKVFDIQQEIAPIEAAYIELSKLTYSNDPLDKAAATLLMKALSAKVNLTSANYKSLEEELLESQSALKQEVAEQTNQALLAAHTAMQAQATLHQPSPVIQGTASVRETSIVRGPASKPMSAAAQGGR